MSIGFAATTQTSDQFIKNFFKQKKNIRNEVEFEMEKRNFKNDDAKNLLNPINLNLLLDPKYKAPAFYKNPKFEGFDDIDIHFQTEIGLWSIWTYFEPHNGDYNFTVSVNGGNVYSFHPENIEKRVVSKFGETAYQTWKQHVLDDIDGLQMGIDQIRKHKDKIVTKLNRGI